jgi:hypothetical protein
MSTTKRFNRVMDEARNRAKDVLNAMWYADPAMCRAVGRMLDKHTAAGLPTDSATMLVALEGDDLATYRRVIDLLHAELRRHGFDPDAPMPDGLMPTDWKPPTMRGRP